MGGYWAIRHTTLQPSSRWHRARDEMRLRLRLRLNGRRLGLYCTRGMRAQQMPMLGFPFPISSLAVRGLTQGTPDAEASSGRALLSGK